jgi:hypothetical protein
LALTLALALALTLALLAALPGCAALAALTIPLAAVLARRAGRSVCACPVLSAEAAAGTAAPVALTGDDGLLIPHAPVENTQRSIELTVDLRGAFACRHGTAARTSTAALASSLPARRACRTAALRTAAAGLSARRTRCTSRAAAALCAAASRAACIAAAPGCASSAAAAAARAAENALVR